jgi:hypothetical protein
MDGRNETAEGIDRKLAVPRFIKDLLLAVGPRRRQARTVR